MDTIKRITLLGTSGVGKTTLSAILQAEGWYHYSGDYRIATRYLAEPINAWLETLTAENPTLSALLTADALSIQGRVAIDNLAILSAYIGKLGQQGYDEQTFKARQQAFAQAEAQAMYDVPDFIARSQRRGYAFFINDAGGSVGELDDERLFALLKQHTLPIYIDADADLEQELIARAIRYPKPICYHAVFLQEMIASYAQRQDNIAPSAFDSDDFIRFVSPQMFAHRRLRYRRIAERYGVTLDAKAVWQVRDGQDFQTLLTATIATKQEHSCH